MAKFNKILLYVLMGLSVVLGVVFYMNSSSDSMISLMRNWAYILFALALLFVIVLPFFHSTGKSKKGALVKLALALVVCVISYLLASGDPVELSKSVAEPSATTLKWVDTGLILCIILAVVAFLSIFSRGLLNLFRK